jgi:ferredoxin
VIGFVFRKKGRNGLHYTAPYNVLRYTIFALTILLLIVGSGFLLNLLDPFSAFGRIFSNLVRPVILAVNNAAAIGMEAMGVHLLYREQWAVIAPLSVGVSIGTLMLVALLSARHGRLYCNTVCPVGVLLGLVSKYSMLRIGIDPDACTGCGLCESVCKAGCIDSQQKTVDVSRCVGCYNCLAVCRGHVLRFENRWRPRIREVQPDLGRRNLMVGLAMGVAGMSVNALGQTSIIQSRPSTIPEKITAPVSPPGSGSIAHFTSICTACHLCVSACPSRVLVPSFLQYGLSGMMQPRMDYHAGHCNYDCTVCLNVCPSGAIVPLTPEKKKLTQLGVAKFIKENCVVYTDNTNCGACSEHCPTKAVDMVPYLNTASKRLVIPEVNPDICIGCGGCEYACPTKPHKAIYVDGNRVHKLAEKPVEKKIDEKVDYKEDFPF